MYNFSQLNENELIEILASYTDKYTESFKIGADCQNQHQYKDTIDEVVNEFSRRRYESFGKHQQH